MIALHSTNSSLHMNPNSSYILAVSSDSSAVSTLQTTQYFTVFFATQPLLLASIVSSLSIISQTNQVLRQYNKILLEKDQYIHNYNQVYNQLGKLLISSLNFIFRFTILLVFYGTDTGYGKELI